MIKCFEREVYSGVITINDAIKEQVKPKNETQFY